MAEMIGGHHTITAAAQVLSSDTTMCAQLTIRSNTGNTVCYFGGSDVTSAPANAHGHIKADESYTFGPFDRGGVRPSQVYISGTASDILFWNGVPA